MGEAGRLSIPPVPAPRLYGQRAQGLRLMDPHLIALLSGIAFGNVAAQIWALLNDK